MRIIHLLKTASPKGAGVTSAALGLAKALAKYETVEQAIFSTEEPLPADLTFINGINATCFPIWPPKSFAYAPKLLEQLCEFQPDIIHLHGLWAYNSIAVQRAHARIGARIVISIHGMLNPWAISHKGLKKIVAAKLYEKRNLDNAACIHALTPIEASYCRDYGVKAPVSVIPSGIERPPIVRPNARSGNRTLLFLGRIHPVKGIEELLMAWAAYKNSISKNREQWRLSLVGWGEESYVNSMKELVAQLSINDSVTFEGPKFGDEKWKAYDSADAFILSSRSEAMPMAALEALASGLPLVMTRDSGLSEAVSNGAALVASSDPEDIARAIGKLCQLTDERRQAMGRMSTDSVMQRFSWPVTADAFVQLYRWTLGKGAQPASVLKTL